MPQEILFVHNHLARFVQIDRDLLRERWPVREWYERTRRVNLPALAAAVAHSKLVFGWFASWHTFWPLVFAQAFHKPAVLVIGGYDLAAQAAIGYGHQRGGAPQWVSRWIMRHATRLMTNSHYSQQEAHTNVGLPLHRVPVLYHGVPDPFGALPPAPARPIVLTVGNVDQGNLWRKGHLPFVQAAALMPELEWVLVGGWHDRAIEVLRAQATPNMTFTNRIADAALNDYYQRAAVYVQASAHEGFGLGVAEAMLGGCIPVVTRAGALPEVVGDTGVYVAQNPTAIAAGVQAALAAPGVARQAARDRVLTHFPLAQRRAGLFQLVECALTAH